MTPAIAAAMKRLDEVLAAEPQGPTRHAQVVELARQHADPQRQRPEGVCRKAVAVADVEAPDETTGWFTARISDFETDRTGERFTVGSFDNAIARLRQRGLPLPVLFSHNALSISNVLGLVQPQDVWADRTGLYAKGWIDIGDPAAARIFRMIKRGAIQWSIGFSLAQSRRGHDGVRELTEVRELLELSAVPTPANERTATLGAKSDRRPPTVAELRDRERALGLEPRDDDRLDAVRRQMRDEMLELLSAADEQELRVRKNWKDSLPTPEQLQRWVAAETASVPLANLAGLRRVEQDTASVPAHDLNGDTSLEDRLEGKALAAQPIRTAVFHC
jgi:HK97 family phage prohead protease